MTSEMVERVARAICRCDCNPLTQSEISIGLYVDKRWDEFTHKAIAAIEAMREPTEEMVSVASDEMIRVNEESMGLSFSKLNKEMAKVAWSASVSAALKGNNSE